MDKNQKIGAAVIILGVLALVFSAFLFIFLPNYLGETVDLRLGDGTFKTGLALDEGGRSSSVLGVSNSSVDKPLLLAYPNEARLRFSSKSIVEPVDLVWLNRNKKVVYIAKNVSAKNSNSTTFESELPAKYILKVRAGFVDDRDIDINQVAKFQLDEGRIH